MIPIKRLLFAVAAMLLFTTVEAQQTALFNHYIYQPFLYNPAQAGSGANGEYRLSLAYRNQWVGLEDAPNSVMAVFDASPFKLEKHSSSMLGLGLYLVNDKRHTMQTLNAGMQLAGHLPISKESKVSLGLKLGMLNNSFDFVGKNFTHPNDQVLNGKDKMTKIDLGFGLNYNYSNEKMDFNLGLASGQFSDEVEIVEGSLFYDLNMHLLGTASAKFNFNKAKAGDTSYYKMAIEPILLYRFANGVAGGFDLGLRTHIMNVVWVGVGARLNNHPSYHLSLGVTPAHNFTITGGYELSGNLGSSFEAGISYNFGKKKPDVLAKIKTQNEIDKLEAIKLKETERLKKEEEDRLAAEQKEKERLEKERIAQEQKNKELAEKARLEKERLEKERLAAEQKEKERIEKERIAQENKNKELAEKARLEKERLEKERLAAEQKEKERLEKERLAQEQKNKELAEKARLEKERLEQERLAALEAKCRGIDKTPIYKKDSEMKNRLQAKGFSFDMVDAGIISLGGSKIVYQYAEENEGFIIPDAAKLAKEIAEVFKDGTNECKTKSLRLANEVPDLTMTTKLVETAEELDFTSDAVYNGELGDKPSISYTLDGVAKTVTINNGPLSLKEQALLKLLNLKVNLLKEFKANDLIINEDKITFNLKSTADIDSQRETGINFTIKIAQ